MSYNTGEREFYAPEFSYAVHTLPMSSDQHVFSLFHRILRYDTRILIENLRDISSILALIEKEKLGLGQLIADPKNAMKIYKALVATTLFDGELVVLDTLRDTVDRIREKYPNWSVMETRAETADRLDEEEDDALFEELKELKSAKKKVPLETKSTTPTTKKTTKKSNIKKGK